MFYEDYQDHWHPDSIGHSNTPSDRARSTFYYVQGIGHFKTLSNYYTKRSGHNSYLIIYTISGTGYLTYKNKEYQLNSGDLMFIDCMEPHHYWTDKNDLWEMLWVHFNGSNTKGYYEQFKEHNNPVINATIEETYSKWLTEILTLHNNGDLQREIHSSRLLVNCLSQLLIDVQAYALVHLPETIKSIQTYIEQHYTETITLESLSHEFGISKYHLSRIYKKSTGFSPIDFQISLRISMAKNLLQYTNNSIQEISYAIGIDNVSHFINVFKKRESMTPLQFRKLNN